MSETDEPSLPSRQFVCKLPYWREKDWINYSSGLEIFSPSSQSTFHGWNQVETSQHLIPAQPFKKYLIILTIKNNI